nr:MAG TPA: hypothetical protein [Caudoviricetes sp.]
MPQSRITNLNRSANVFAVVACGKNVSGPSL